ncbi:hypothetical protein P3X46_021868 [Hevea brasiliensis]|uniref:F-box domain-containing protein n=2 Tax=Hevea brasiliensis TaxID=3981 RepID=A0ABQ9LGZ8_HEVBR|nr:F-box/kelch-repeat protein At3g23880 isoform X1 [Hevea brasiliensis]XP_021681984.1 F-box/kelch-repeat protein At3g23880 isoform X1 [Hevea brasiliensis]KAJ9167201.1 hypothetical protein P3X46_021868 [Hevea brasiliensis]
MRESMGLFPGDGNRSKIVRRNSRLWRMVQERRASRVVKYRACEGEYFSSDFVFQILVLLPIKSLVRLSCVCKTWFNLINSFAFADAHLQLCETTLICLDPKPQFPNPYTLSIDLRLGLEQFSIFPTDSSRQYQQGHLHFLEVQNSKIKVVELNITCSGNILATCDGLILVQLGKNKGIVVMNPMTRKLIRYPLGTVAPISRNLESYGFMYSNHEGKYKVVHLFIDKRLHVGCEILSVGTKSWRGVDGPSLGLVRKFAQESVSAIGALHWVPDTHNCEYIVSMDIDRETFFTIPLPSAYKRRDRLVELWGFLGLITHNAQPFVMDIWICKGLHGEAWSKQHTIHIDSVTDDLVPVTASRNAREICFESRGDGCYYVYDFQHQEMRRIEMEKKPGWNYGPYLPFVNSLVSWENPRDL